MAYKIPPLTYPKEAFMAGVFIIDEKGEVKTIYPFDSVYNSLEEISEQCRTSFEFNKRINKRWGIHEISIVLPIDFERHFPLKPEYWQNPTATYDDIQRMSLFNEAFTALPLFQLLVTPIFNPRERKWHFNAAIPFKITASDREVESFMLSSDYSVDERAKYAAIYKFGKPIRYNWRKEKVLKKKFRNLATKN